MLTRSESEITMSETVKRQLSFCSVTNLLDNLESLKRRKKEKTDIHFINLCSIPIRIYMIDHKNIRYEFMLIQETYFPIVNIKLLIAYLGKYKVIIRNPTVRRFVFKLQYDTLIYS